MRTRRRFLCAVILAELITLILLARISSALAHDLKRFERRAAKTMQLPRA